MTVPAAEYAFLALRVYNRNAENKGPLPSDWDEIAYLPDDASGFSAGAFRNKLTGEVVISFTGTNERKVADFVNANIPAAGGLYSTQVMKAIEFVSDIRAQEPAADITFTGHSLGGGLASLMATYFDLPATIFDPAPFKNSASRLNASFVGTRSTVLTYLATYVLYQQTTGRPVDSKFLAYGAGFVAGDYNLLYSGRAKNVNGFETTGEVLEGLRDFLPTVVTSLEPVNPGPNTLASDTLHSMALLASLQWSPNFATALRGSQVATDLLFDETLYALHEPAVDPGRDFISDLARNEIGVAGAPNDSGNHLLEHFAHDVIAVTPSSADLLSKTMQSGLVAGVMEFYWEGDFLQTAGEPAEFAELVNGGVHLDFTRTLSSQDKGRHRLADAAVSTVDFSGIAGAGTTDILTALALINSSQSWYIQTQSASPLVITDVGASNANDVILNFRGQAVVHGGGGNDLIVGAKDSYDDTLYGDGGADILMGGGGNDILYGGDDADILVGGGGNDVLVGGAGIDTYILNPGDGFDEIADSGHDGTLVMGGATLSAATWTQFTERGILNPKWYAVVGSKQFTAMFVDWEPVVGAPLGTLTGTLLITEEGMASDVALDDYTMGDFGINLPGGASNTFHAPYYQKALDRLGAIYAESLQTVSPLILDLDGDGVETVSSSAGVHFDHDANGLAEATGWVGADDGLLVRDLNGNGLIDNGHELFGNNTLLPNGTYAGNGFEALKALDSNSDTKISSSDSAFSQLRIWKDANGNGLVDSGELLTLSQAGVSSISTAYASESFVDLNGNTHQQTGSYLTTGGATRNANDVWFTKGPTANVNVSALSPGSAIAALPDLDGLGSVLSLHDAMVNDTAGHLQSLVSAFVNEPDPAVRAGLLDGLIFAWANVEAVNPSSRGTYFPDARKLTALEKFLGVSFVQGSGTNSGTGSPGPQATQVLLRAYDSIAALFGANLLAPTQHADLYAGSHLISDPVTHTLSWDISGTISALQAAYATDATRGAALMNEFASALKQLGDESALMLETLRKQGSVAASGFSYQLATMGYASVLTGTSNADTLTAQNGDDLVLGAAGADTLFGLGGDDEIQGGDGNDHLQGGLGNDVLIGGAGDDQLSGGDDAYYQTFPAQPINVGADGDDTFVYARGDGRDTIHEVGAVGWDKDPGRNDVIRFGAGVNVNDLVLTANSNRGTLTINFRDPGGSISTADSLTIEGYFLGDDFFRFDDASGDHHAIERSVATFRFDDTGAVYTAQELEELLLPANTTGDNFITGTSGDDVINGMGGKDTIYGGDGNDTIYASGETRLHGGSGNDFLKGTSWLFGNGGDDTLEGLSGSTVYGGEGSDTYLYNLGDGDVSIGDKSTFDSAAGAVDVLRFGPGIRPSDVVVKRATTVSNDDGAQFFVTNSLTRQRSIVTAYNALSVINGTSVLDEVRFDDGTVWTHEDLYARYLTGDVTPNIIQGFDRDDVIRGNGGDDTLRGGNGIDDLGGGAGNDELEGDAGDDTYRFGRGQGHDEIKDTQGFNRIVLDTGIAVGDVALTRTSTAVRFGASTADALVLTLNTGEELWLRDFFAGSATVGEIQFIDGTVWNAAQIAAHTVDQSGTAGTQNGTASDDTFVVDHRSDVINEPASSGTDTVVSSVSYTLPANIENLTLSGALGITGTGNTLDNTLTGNGGANVLDGGRGIDTLIGGLGDDTYVVDMDGSWPDTPQFYNFPGSRLQGFQDFVTELSGEGNDTLVAYHLYSVTLPDNIENLVIQGLTYGSISYNLTQDVRRKFTGNALDNVIDATFAEDVGVGIGDTFFGNGAGGEIVIDGGAGADTMIGAPLSERFIVDNVNDIVLNGNAGDTIESSVSYTLPSSVGILKLTGTAAIDATGTSATDSLVGNGANNILSGGGGNDLLDGGAGADTLDGGAGNDTLTGGTEADSMAGGVGDDLYSVDNSGDVVTEVADAGTDIVQSSINYLLGDNIENLTLTGGALSAIGNALDNVITGNGSSNVIDGGAGDDRLIGGAGADTYLNFGWGRGNDVITDTQGISAVRFATDQNIAADDLKFQRVGNDLRIGISGADSVTVQSWFTTAAANRVGSVTLSEGGLDFTYTAPQIEGLIGGANSGPVLNTNSPLGTVSIEAATTLGYEVARNAFLDIESQHSLSYAASLADGSALPSWLQFDAATQTFSGTPPVGAVGALSLHLTATDAGGLSVVGNLTLQVTPAAIRGTAGDDSLAGTSGDDIMDGLAGNDVLDALDGNDQLFGRDGNDTLKGGIGTDVLDGASGDDLLDGGAGADQMDGGDGQDTYVVDDAGDVVIEDPNEGTDEVRASLAYTLGSNVENLTLTGSAVINGTGNTLDNILVGNSANNTLTGLDGNDVLDGGAGNDSMSGGQGNDTYVLDSSSDTVSEGTNQGTDTVKTTVNWTLGTNFENLVLLGSGNLTGTGNTLANTITGNSGNNALSGGTGADTMLGAAGNDTYTVDNVADTVVENAGEGTDLVQSSVSFTLSSNVENLTLTGSSGLSATGNGLDNVLTGNSGANTLTGNAGNDTLNGGTGADALLGGIGDDIYVVDNAGDVITESSGEGTDLVQSSITYTLGNNLEKLTLTGSSAINGTGNSLDNILTGNGNSNTLTGAAGNDTLDGGSGTDTLLGGAGNDIYVVDVSGDVTTENASEGIDLVNSAVTRTLGSNIELLFLTGGSTINGTGNTLANLLRGNSVVNVLAGGGGTDILEGGAGNDTLSNSSGGNTYFNGGDGADGITGTASNDLLLGGTGNDTLTTGTGADIIGFNKGDGQDTVNISTVKDNTLSIGGGATYADLVFQKSSNDLILKVGATDQIKFSGYYTSTSNRSINKLQVVIEGTADYLAGGSDVTRDNKTETFNFDGLVSAFDTARALNPSLTSWALTNALTAQYLSGSDTAAIGGDLAYRYGRFGTLSDISFTPAQGILNDSGFGTAMQNLQSLASLQDPTQRLS